jgi:hypothetical protein
LKAFVSSPTVLRASGPPAGAFCAIRIAAHAPLKAITFPGPAVCGAVSPSYLEVLEKLWFASRRLLLNVAVRSLEHRLSNGRFAVAVKFAEGLKRLSAFNVTLTA